MLLGKEPSKFEVYNDIEGELVNFFRVCLLYTSDAAEKLEV